MSDTPLPGLRLKKTRLYFADQKLWHGEDQQNADGAFSLEDVTGVRVERKLQIVLPTFFLLFTIGLGAISWGFIPIAGWSWVAVLACAVGAMFALLTFRTEVIILDTEDGEVEYTLSDPWEEAQGFAVSINRMIRRNSDPGVSGG